MNKYLKKCLTELIVIFVGSYITYMLFLGSVSMDNKFSSAFIGGGLTMFIATLIENSDKKEEVEDEK